jgi:spermidine synthase
VLAVSEHELVAHEFRIAVNFDAADECSYQEMMAHVPLFTHKAPESVLIVGGGDGGVLREVTKHGRVSEITLCEIDE